MKFTRIDYSRLMEGNYGIGKQIHTIVKRIILTMEDGSTKEIQSEADKDGNGLIDLTKYGTVVGWRMEMKDDFVLQSGQELPSIAIQASRIQKRRVTMKRMRPKMITRTQAVSPIKHSQMLPKIKQQIGPSS